MMHRLRKIAVTVDEPLPGHFFWILLEARGGTDAWEVLTEAPLSSPRWSDAFNDGWAAMDRLVSDGALGPRSPGDDEDADPVG